MENQEMITKIENYISNELKGLNGEDLLNQVSRFYGEVSEDIEELYIELEPLAMEYFDEIMEWHNNDMRNNPEEYGTTAEEIEEDDDEYWDEDGFQYHKWNHYFKELIQEAIEAVNFETAESIKEAMDNDCHMDWSDCKTAYYFTTYIDYDGDTDVQVNVNWLTEDNELQIYADRGYYNNDGYQEQEILPATEITINDIPSMLAIISKNIETNLQVVL